MGVLPKTLLLVQLNMEETTQDTIIKENNNNNSNIGSIWKQNSMQKEDQELANKATRSSYKRSIRRRRSNVSSVMKKRRSRSSSTRLDQRVSTLRNLVPNDDDDNVRSLEQLFTQTADYILSLQTRVRLMKTLVDVFGSSSSSSSIDE